MRWTRIALALLSCVIAAVACAAAPPPPPVTSPPANDVAAMAQALRRAHQAVLGVRTLAVEDARSATYLGRSREGSGVVIGNDGLVLTIGYLVLEADQVQLVLDPDRIVPARVVAYDVATGFGLLQALTPLRIPAVPLGTAASLSANEPLMVATGGDDGGVSIAQLVARHPFVGYWEYEIDDALFTSPARTDHSGAGLFNAHGELLGIGSLFVADAIGRDDAPHVPGNMFVPIDLLKPVLEELRRDGSSRASRRAWLGINAVEREGHVSVMRVSDDSPAEVAGVLAGDRIVRIDGTDVGGALDVLWKSLWRGGAPEREVTLEIRRGDETKTVKVQTVDRMKTLRRAQGI
jgi:S1-C subfamily serine protease